MADIEKGAEIPNYGTGVSKFRFYSYGVVAADKELNSRDIEVNPREQFSLMDGAVTDNVQPLQGTGTMENGQSYDKSVDTTSTIKASWLPFTDTNRRTPPDVRIGEGVMIYQVADEPTFFWTTLKDDFHLRRLETVMYAIQANPNGFTDDYTDCYVLTMSSHTKQITLHTTKKNGEPFEYTVQLDTNYGRFVITDDQNNYFVLDSKERRIELRNADGASLMLDKEDLKIVIPQNADIQIGKNCTIDIGAILKIIAGQSGTLETPITNIDSGVITLGGNVNSKPGKFGGRGNMSMRGDMDLDGSAVFRQDVTAGQNLTANKIISITAIQAPNV